MADNSSTSNNIFKNGTFKVLAVFVAIMIAASALAASIYLSFQNDLAKHTRPMVKKAPVDTLMDAQKNKSISQIDKATYKLDLYDGNFGRVNPFDVATVKPVKSLSTKAIDSLLVAPPDAALEDTEAGLVMTTTVSGIMYDGINSSALINIEGTEYFVKPNDVVNKYKVLSINPTQVVVQYGKNIYQAGVGEIFTPPESNSNIVNLNKKFGGNSNANDISINIRKK